MSRYTYSSAGIKTQVLERDVVMHQINTQMHTDMVSACS